MVEHQAALSEKGPLHDVEVRMMEFDLQLSTARFQELLPEFEDHGLAFQMTRRVPDTLTLHRVPEEAVDQFSLEVCIGRFTCHTQLSARSWLLLTVVLDRALQKPEVKEIAY